MKLFGKKKGKSSPPRKEAGNGFVMDDGETQCGSRVPLFNAKFSDASLAGTASLSPDGSPVSPKQEMKRKRSFLGLVNRARSRSRGDKKRVQEAPEEELWVQPWQDIALQQPSASSEQTAQQEDASYTEFSKQSNVGGVSVPIAAKFPFDEDGSMDMVASWINDADATTGSEEDTDAGTGTLGTVDDESTLSTKGTGGSIYTYSTGFTRASGEESSYAASSAFPGLQLASGQSSNHSVSHSLSYSQSTISGTPAVQGNSPSKPSVYIQEEIQTEAKDRITIHHRIEEEPEPTDDKETRESSMVDVIFDIGAVAGEIIDDVRESLSCMVDTTRESCMSKP